MIEKVLTTDSSEQFYNKILSYLESTDKENWIEDYTRNKDNTKGCLSFHLFNFGGNDLVNLFEEMCATTYMYYPINDGENTKYQQDNPKDRCIAYIKDLRDGKQKTVYQLMEEELEEQTKVYQDIIFK